MIVFDGPQAIAIIFGTLLATIIVLCVILWSMAGSIHALESEIAEHKRERKLDAEAMRLAREEEATQ